MIEACGSGVATGFETVTADATVAAVVASAEVAGVKGVRPGHDADLNAASHSSMASSDVLRPVVTVLGRKGRCDACNPMALRFRTEISS
jgi:hypothetical protein